MYYKVFDVSLEPFTAWHIALVPATFGALLFVTLFASAMMKEQAPRTFRLVVIVACIVSGVFAAAILWTVFAEADNFRYAVAHGEAHSIEGLVTNFVPEGVGGHPPESFRINGRSFKYSSYSITSAFHTLARDGGPIHSGVHVRIKFLGQAILQIDTLSRR